MTPRLRRSPSLPRLRPRPTLWLAVFLVPLVALSQVGADGVHVLQREISLRRGADSSDLVALLTRGTTVTVIERQGEWVKVNVEGWMPATALMVADGREAPTLHSTAPATAPPAASETSTPDHRTPGVPPSRPAPPDRASRTVAAAGPRVEGQIQLRTGRRQRARTAGLEVMLLPADFDLDSSPDERQRLEKLDAEVQRLQRQADRAMREDNFTQAMARRDALMKERSDVLDERSGLLAAVHGRHQAAARNAALATVITDEQGWYSIPGVADGSYTVYTRLVRDANNLDVEWIVPVVVAGDVVRHDLDESLAAGLVDKAD